MALPTLQAFSICLWKNWRLICILDTLTHTAWFLHTVYIYTYISYTIQIYSIYIYIDTYDCMAILCDPFGMVKGPFQGLSDLQPEIKRSLWITWFMYLIICYFLPNSFPFKSTKFIFFQPPFNMFLLAFPSPSNKRTRQSPTPATTKRFPSNKASKAEQPPEQRW